MSSVNPTMVASPQEAAIDADAALGQLYAGHYHSLVRVAVLLLRDQGLAEDAVQDSFVAVHRHSDRVDSEAEIAAALGISKGAVKTHASRGAAALRRTLEEDS